jgi:hypothetical protein
MTKWHPKWPRRRPGNRGSTPKASLAELKVLPPSPLLQLSPTAELTQIALADALQRQCDDIFCQFIGGDTVNVVFQGITAASTGADLTYRFSDHAMRLYRSGQADIAVHHESGKLLPMMKDPSGKFIEYAKGTISTVPKLSQIVSLVVAAAHLIAGNDLSKRIAKMQRSIDRLTAGRQK